MNLFWHWSINFGDILSPYLLSKFSGFPIDKIKYVPHNSPDKKFILTGSILSCDHIQNAVIFGAGFAWSNNYFTGSDIVIAGVRGHMSLGKIREYMDLEGNKNIRIDDKVVVGEPSLCLPMYTPMQKIKNKFKLGVIPHVADYVKALIYYGATPDVIVIDLRWHNGETMTQCIERVISQICMCEQTICSALHGIIVSTAYQVPTEWCKFNEGVTGGDGFKYYDYISSIGSIVQGDGYIQPVDLTTSSIDPDVLIRESRKIVNTKIDPAVIRNSRFLNM